MTVVVLDVLGEHGVQMFGVVGALIAIPVAAAALSLAEEVLYPRLDRA
ncbi:hypothetical protein [Kutzneria kofuensis]|uniref:Putative PurR-regulated permease PerM n=1 Tax=Kutzneria kofuensis TaxID=103725 RepID=A0A7W9KCG9_9PSEU|nr:hypothetical protein [Kutzneria kofuensis]MBB5889930.1 putative PurR-regulated permease PerM [Kutzneria kofuensis]